MRNSRLLIYFEAAFPGEAEPVTFEDATTALAAFEETLIPPNAPFDRFLHGDDAAMTDAQKARLQHFIDSGSAAQHRRHSATAALSGGRRRGSARGGKRTQHAPPRDPTQWIRPSGPVAFLSEVNVPRAVRRLLAGPWAAPR